MGYFLASLPLWFGACVAGLLATGALRVAIADRSSPAHVASGLGLCFALLLVCALFAFLAAKVSGAA